MFFQTCRNSIRTRVHTGKWSIVEQESGSKVSSAVNIRESIKAEILEKFQKHRIYRRIFNHSDGKRIETLFVFPLQAIQSVSIHSNATSYMY